MDLDNTCLKLFPNFTPHHLITHTNQAQSTSQSTEENQQKNAINKKVVYWTHLIWTIMVLTISQQTKGLIKVVVASLQELNID